MGSTILTSRFQLLFLLLASQLLCSSVLAQVQYQLSGELSIQSGPDLLNIDGDAFDMQLLISDPSPTTQTSERTDYNDLTGGVTFDSFSPDITSSFATFRQDLPLFDVVDFGFNTPDGVVAFILRFDVGANGAIPPLPLYGSSPISTGLAQHSGATIADNSIYVIDNPSLTATLVPEPSSLAIISIGLLALLGKRRKPIKACFGTPARLFSLLLAIAVLDSHAFAEVTDWSNPNEGAFGQNSNWSTGVVPASTDTARFGITPETTSQDISVTFASTHTLEFAEVISGEYEWQLNATGSNLGVSETLRVGSTALVNPMLPDVAELVIVSSDATSSVETKRLSVGVGGSRAAQLTLDSATLTSTAGPSLGNANISLLNGAQLLTGSDLEVASLGSVANTTTTASIDGPGTLWHNTETQFWIGHGPIGGNGEITITNGGELSSDNSILLGNSSFGGRGYLSATGSGSLVNANFTRVLSDSTLEILNGAKFQSTGPLDIGADSLADSSFIARGENTEINVGETLYMSGFGGARGGQSLLDIENASVRIDGNAILHPGSTIDMQDGTITIGGGTAQSGKLTLSDNLLLEGSPIINGSLVNVSGRLRPSDFPARGQRAFGTIALAGDLELDGGTLFADVGAGSDLISFSGGNLLIGGNLEINLIDDTPIKAGDSYTIFSGFGSHSGSFANIIDNTPYEFRFEVIGDTGRLIATIPEPTALVLLLVSSVLLLGLKRRSTSVNFRAAAMLLVLCSASSSQAAEIDFEDGIAPDLPIPSDHYEGVTFTNAVWAPVGGAFGEGNFGLGVDEGLQPFNNAQYPGITSPIGIGFDSTQTLVSITAFGVGDQGAQIEAFDTGNNPIAVDNAVGIGAGRDNIVLLSVAAPGISRVELTQHLFRGSDDGVGWDNLVFVPEPSSCAILLFALFAAVTSRKRRVTSCSSRGSGILSYLLLLFLLSSFALPSVASAQLMGSGSTDGIFTDFVDGLGNPIPQLDDITVSGISTNEVFYQQTFTQKGREQPNNILFEGAEFEDIAPGEPFLLGYVTYTNGQWILGPLSTPLRSFVAPLEVSTTPNEGEDTFFNQVLEDTLVLAITDNVDVTPAQAADIIYFENRPDLGSLRVFEEEAASIELFGVFGSLELHSFGEVVSNPGSGFFYPTLESLPSDFTPTATGNGTRPPAPLVPEPSSVLLLVIGGSLFAIRHCCCPRRN